MERRRLDSSPQTAGGVYWGADGLGSFERALERDERVMAVLGSQSLFENAIKAFRDVRA